MSVTDQQPRYRATWDSLRTHPVPGWFDDAKLGALIHWTPASIPAWAPVEGDMPQLARDKGFDYYFAHNPYTEWYQNTIRIEGSPSQRHHLDTYGPGAAYADFAPLFNAAVAHWDPEDWAQQLDEAGMRYVVFVAKHHDGFLLWPSRHPNPRIPGYQTSRDVIGELADAVRRRGIKLGLYYSGGLDWTFDDSVITDIPSLFRGVGQSPESVAYVDAHWRELIERYRPDILWGDIGYPAGADLERLFADYYNLVPEGIVNDRFAQDLPDSMDASERVMGPSNEHFDFITPEYSTYDSATGFKWESTRGIGLGFGYNRNETAATHASSTELVRSLVDITSKNGNLLLGVGPMADGTIPPLQDQPMRGLGRWLKSNGEAIYDTRPWLVSEAATDDGIPVRFTQGRDAVYAILMGDVSGREIRIRGLEVAAGSELDLLGAQRAVAWDHGADGLVLRLASAPPAAAAHVVRISPRPTWSGDRKL